MNKIIILTSFLMCFADLFTQDLVLDSIKKSLQKKGYSQSLIDEHVNGYKRKIKKRIAIENQETHEPQMSSSTSNSSSNIRCMNADFEMGDFSGWNGKYGVFTADNEIFEIVNEQNGMDPNRHSIISNPLEFDYYGNFPKIWPQGTKSVQLGNAENGAQTEALYHSIFVDDDNKLFEYHYSVVLENPAADHLGNERPRFVAKMLDENQNIIPCSYYEVTADPNQPDLSLSNNLSLLNPGTQVFYRSWASNIVDLTAYLNTWVTLEFRTFDCSHEGHFAYAYVDANCTINGIDYEEKNDCSRIVNFINNYSGNYLNEEFSWSFGDGTNSSEIEPTHHYEEAGNYTIQLTINTVNGNGENCSFSFQENLVITECEMPCADCIPSFAPTPGKYIVSAWVKEKNASVFTKKYETSTFDISIQYDGTQVSSYSFLPKGKIIDGWQRIEEEIIVPENSSEIKLIFNTSNEEAYFDDIRFLPYDGSMMSYVYDPISLRLMAELDERNYATLYEYDEEGKLIRVKKETEKGKMTIKENRDKMVKK